MSTAFQSFLLDIITIGTSPLQNANSYTSKSLVAPSEHPAA